jgi:hypothetical protein
MSEPMNDTEADYSDIDMEELDSYLTSPPVRVRTTPGATRAPFRRALLDLGARRRPRSRPRRFKIRSTHRRFAATRGEASRANARVARVPSIPPTLTPPPPHPRPRR